MDITKETSTPLATQAILNTLHPQGALVSASELKLIVSELSVYPINPQLLQIQTVSGNLEDLSGILAPYSPTLDAIGMGLLAFLRHSSWNIVLTMPGNGTNNFLSIGVTPEALSSNLNNPSNLPPMVNFATHMGMSCHSS
jgi:hypothetical protein